MAASAPLIAKTATPNRSRMKSIRLARCDAMLGITLTPCLCILPAPTQRFVQLHQIRALRQHGFGQLLTRLYRL